MDRICCFYANEEHLASILLPYIDEKIKENYSIVAMFEKNIGKSFEKIGKIFQTNKETLIKIDSIFMDKPKNDKTDIAIIFGTDKYIEKKLKFTKEINTVIICYGILEDIGKIKKIIETNNKVLLTSGLVQISEYFKQEKRETYSKV